MKKRQQLIIFVIVLVVVIGGSVAAALFFSQYSTPKDQAKKTETGQPQRLPSEQKADVADKQAFEGDVAAGVKTLDDAIKSTTDSSEQFIYYSRKATLLFNYKDFAGAFDAAVKAYDIENTSDAAAFVGQIARAKGDNTQALTYYKKAIELIDKTDPFADEDAEHYQGVVKELGG